MPHHFKMEDLKVVLHSLRNFTVTLQFSLQHSLVLVWSRGCNSSVVLRIWSSTYFSWWCPTKILFCPTKMVSEWDISFPVQPCFSYPPPPTPPLVKKNEKREMNQLCYWRSSISQLFVGNTFWLSFTKAIKLAILKNCILTFCKIC